MYNQFGLFISALALHTFVQLSYAEVNQQATKTLPESRNQMIKLTDRGLEPVNLRMTTADSILFFLNDSTDALATLEIDFGSKATHCSSGNLQIDPNGLIRSVEPFGPKDFASVCFHEPGRYPVKVYGLKAKPSGILGEVIVE